jgi:hypothetical protein
MRCECQGREHIVVVYGQIGTCSRSDNGKLPLAGHFTVKIEDALSVQVSIADECLPRLLRIEVPIPGAERRAQARSQTRAKASPLLALDTLFHRPRQTTRQRPKGKQRRHSFCVVYIAH